MSENVYKNRKKARIIALSWLVCYCLFGAVCTGLTVREIILNGGTVMLLSPLGLVITFGISLVFYPWMFFVRHYAKAANWKPVKIISTVVLCLMTFWSVGMVTVTILAAAGVLY